MGSMLRSMPISLGRWLSNPSKKLVGSPETVSRKIRTLYKDVGGFGSLTTMVFDQSDNQKGWDKSMRLMAEEVIPGLADLVPA